MNIEQLRNAGAFVAADVVKVPVQWNDLAFDVCVKRIAFAEAERLMHEAENPSVALIAAAVLLGDEQTPISREDAERLDVALAGKLLEAVNKVNAPKN